MATTARRFYTSDSADDQTFTSEGGIRRLEETNSAVNVFNTITWTTTTVTEKTYIPGTNNSAAGDTSMNNGFALNNGGAIGLESTSNARRWIKAGVWNFGMGINVNTPALLDTHAITVTAKVYRVASGGGARTLLFTATSANITGNINAVWSSASQPEYILEAGEVIMVGFTFTTASTTALILGANTNTVITAYRGNSVSYVEVPAPGIRTLGIGTFSASGATTPSGRGTGIFSGVFSSAGVASVAAIATNLFSGVFSGNGIANALAVGASRFAGVFSAAGAAIVDAIGASRFAGIFSAQGTATTDTIATAIFSGQFEASGDADSDWVASSVGSGVFSGNGVASSDWKASSVAGAVFNADGVTTPSWKQTGIFSGVFSASASAVGTAIATAIFSGVFNADGMSDTAAVGTAIFSGVFEAEGVAETVGYTSSVSATVFSSEGYAEGDFNGGKILSGVFNADVGGGGSSETIIRPIYLFDD